MRVKSVVLAAAVAWMMALAVPTARADLPIKPLESKDVFSVNSDPWVPDSRDPRRIIAQPGQSPAEIDREARMLRVLKVYLYFERFLRAYGIGGFTR